MGYEANGPNVIGPYVNSAAPGAGTDEVQTLTIGGTPTGGTFRLDVDGNTTGNITWVNVNATLVAAINTALDAVLGASQVVAAAGTITAGIGTITLTYSGSRYAKRAMPAATVAANNLTGTSPTLAVAETTPGVTATNRVGAAKGALLVDTAAGILYVNTGTAASPTWTKVGTQT